MSHYNDSIDRARTNYAASDHTVEWRNLPYGLRQEYIHAAGLQIDREAQAAAEVEARRVKLAQVDAYRARIAGTIPAHRLDTRMSGFLDGWDAAMRYMQEQG